MAMKNARMGGVNNDSAASIVEALFESAYEDYRKNRHILKKLNIKRSYICDFCDELITLIEYIDSKKERKRLCELVMSTTTSERESLYELADVIRFIKDDELHLLSESDRKIWPVLNRWDKRIELEDVKPLVIERS